MKKAGATASAFSQPFLAPPNPVQLALRIQAARGIQRGLQPKPAEGGAC